MNVRPIRTSSDHANALRRIGEIFDAMPGTVEADELEVLTTLVSLYEKTSVPAPTPIDAILFRLEQAGLTKRALEPLLGSRSRVSEVLSGERKLTVDMMRALHLHFGIPAESLLGAPRKVEASPASRRQQEPSVRAMADLVASGLMRAKESYADFLERSRQLLAPLAGSQPAHLRKTRTERTNAKTDAAALEAWCAAALLKSLEIPVAKPSRKVRCDMAMARELAALSASPTGLREVGPFLAQRGIALVLLRHLAGTYLDGAAMRRTDGVNVIALTLRYDRIDNFWFTLLHEFAHVACHLGEETSMIFDDLELRSQDGIEAEADDFAQRALIPEEFWTDISADFGTEEVTRIAQAAYVHPAIVAGRWQREFRDYRKFSKLVGHGEVRSSFD
jgi:HTH-type transcriptional regulator/antitoxin HigA